MEFLSAISGRDELLAVLNAAIDRIINKSDPPQKLKKHSAELDFIGNIFTQYCSNQLTKTELLEHFPVINELKECVHKTIEVRKPQVCEHLVKIHNSSCIPLMTSFDWDLKFIIGNSALASFREQKATLMLNCLKGKKSEMISVELNLAMVDKMIKEIEPLCS